MPVTKTRAFIAAIGLLAIVLVLGFTSDLFRQQPLRLQGGRDGSDLPPNDKEVIRDHTAKVLREYASQSNSDQLLRGTGNVKGRRSRIDYETEEKVSARFYTVDVLDEKSYPEYESIKHKPNVGICLSGGGSRSFEASLGYLRALLDADLLQYVRYISSVSGGSWANAVFSYHDEGVVDLNRLLGDYTAPQDMTRDRLRTIPYLSARGFPVATNLITVVVRELLLKGTPPEDIWVKAIHETFLRKAGINIGSIPTWDRESLSKTMAANPTLLNDFDFRMPCSGRSNCKNFPFPIMNNAMLGPIEAAPFGLYQRRYVMMEATPLYIGFPRIQNVTYPNKIQLSLGGLVEPVGFGSIITDKHFCGLSHCPDPMVREIPRPYRPFGIANATAASSWAPGALVAEQPLLRPLDNVLLTAAYFSPLYGGPTREVFVGDGANMENQGLIALLQRNVKRIVMFINTPIPLSDRERYHPHLRPPQQDVDIDSSVTALFGIYSIIPPFGEDFSHDQVFRKADFARVVAAMQDSQSEGNGAVAAVNLKTVENHWWGVKGGRTVHVVFVYLGRAYGWEEALNSEVQDLVAPQRLHKRPNLLPKDGTFKDFPHFSTTKLHLEASLANALADMSAWVVKKNIKIFRNAIKPFWWAKDETDVSEQDRGSMPSESLDSENKYKLDDNDEGLERISSLSKAQAATTDDHEPNTIDIDEVKVAVA